MRRPCGAQDRRLHCEAHALGGDAFARIGADADGQHEVVHEYPVADGRIGRIVPGGERTVAGAGQAAPALGRDQRPDLLHRRGVDRTGAAVLAAQGAAEAEQPWLQHQQARHVRGFQRSGQAREQAVAAAGEHEPAQLRKIHMREQITVGLARGVQHRTGETGLGEQRQKSEVGRAIGKQDRDQLHAPGEG